RSRHERGRERPRPVARGARHGGEAAFYPAAAERDGRARAEGIEGPAPAADRGTRGGGGAGRAQVKLLVATSNPVKLLEVREILAGSDLQLTSLAELGLPPPEEPFETFHENA